MTSESAILIPCYNSAKFLPELFPCIHNQSLPFREILCYDDASNDESADIARSLGAAVLRGSTNRGAAWARNRLIEACTSKYIHFHDADDLLDARFVEVMQALAERSGGAAVCSMRVVNRATRHQRDIVDYTGLIGEADPTQFFLANTGFAIIGMYRTELVKQIGGYREDLRGNEDPDFHVRLAAAGCKFLVEPEPLVTNLIHEQSFSTLQRSRCLCDALLCLQQYAVALPPRYSKQIGENALKLAWLLFECGLRNPARKAISLASSLGVDGPISRHSLINYLAKLISIESTFQLKVARNKLTKGLKCIHHSFQ